ncbi:MAG: ATP-binding cassette domain-containing protein [Spirochaetes bacterium]|nr:ATP-binding cassette domain-containing protein [Spirochaetota bacterium]MBN2769082.1 ATP-binding cassette domain-containing protein [Spirochaetota bacterium]
MIQVKNVTVSFDEIKVLDNISFEVPEKGNLVVLGKNGSGKSVLLKSIAGLINTSEGFIEIDNVKAGPELYENGASERSTVGYVFQKGGLFDSMTVAENIAFGMLRKKYDRSVIDKKIEEVLVSVGLAGSGEKYPSELSGGMQKRVSLARCLCLEPKIMLYDDPAAGLDPVLTDSVADLILAIRESAAITSVTVTHDLKFARKIADTVILLYGGKIACMLEVEDFFSKKDPYAKQFIEGSDVGPIDLF